MSWSPYAASPRRITPWSPRGQLLTELALSNSEGWTQGDPVRAFAYDRAGRMIQARVFTQTTEFVYNGGLAGGASPRAAFHTYNGRPSHSVPGAYVPAAQQR